MLQVKKLNSKNRKEIEKNCLPKLYSKGVAGLTLLPKKSPTLIKHNCKIIN